MSFTVPIVSHDLSRFTCTNGFCYRREAGVCVGKGVGLVEKQTIAKIESYLIGLELLWLARL